MDEKIFDELKKGILILKDEAMNDCVKCYKEMGEDHLVCTVYSAQVMAYGIVLMKLEKLKNEQLD